MSHAFYGKKLSEIYYLPTLGYNTIQQPLVKIHLCVVKQIQILANELLTFGHKDKIDFALHTKNLVTMTIPTSPVTKEGKKRVFGKYLLTTTNTICTRTHTLHGEYI